MRLSNYLGRVIRCKYFQKVKLVFAIKFLPGCLFYFFFIMSDLPATARNSFRLQCFWAASMLHHRRSAAIKELQTFWDKFSEDQS